MKFKKHIFICTNDRGEESARKSCGSCGGMDLRKELVKMINDKGLKGRVRANKSGCLDVCEHGPAVVIYPEGQIPFKFFRGYSGFPKRFHTSTLAV